MTPVCVLRSGGIYGPRHVQALARQIAQWLSRELVCLSDTPVSGVETVPLEHKWPGWWSKMELFRPSISGDLLYFDLDTVIVGPLDDIAAVNKLTLLRDFYRDGIYKGRPEGLGSGLMYLPERDRGVVWDAWIKNPEAAMTGCGSKGDQHFLEQYYLACAARWQDEVSGQVVSLKVHCSVGVPSTARVICAHGRPKFWDLPAYRHLYE